MFKKVAALHAKNTFVFAIVAGDLFFDPSLATPEQNEDVEALLRGDITVPLPTYFSLGKNALPPNVIEKLEASTGEACENLFFLGKRGSVKTSEGLRIASLGGVLDPNLAVGNSKDKFSPVYDTGDASTLRGVNDADILVTSEWPASVQIGSKAGAGQEYDDSTQQQCIAELSTALKPRYHFSTSSNFYEREPFFHPADGDTNSGYAITRFISLAPYGNTTKQKWIYAFSLEHKPAPTLSLPPGATASPFAFIKRKRLAPQEAEFSRFAPHSDNSNNFRPRKRGRPAPLTPDQCFFCLSNPDLAAHLVASIGTDAYMTTAKGPLATGTTFEALQFPCHLLIIPLAHTATLAGIADEATRQSTLMEMRRYVSSLNDMVHAKSSGKLGSLCWEVSRSGGIHTHWQFSPVPVHLIKKGLVEAAFKVEAQNEHYPAVTVSKKEYDNLAPGDVFTATTWYGNEVSANAADTSEGKEVDGENPMGKSVSLSLPLDSSFRFDVQFGRRVLAKLLGLESRLNWRDCEQTEAEETDDVESFKEAWGSYDFTLEG